MDLTQITLMGWQVMKSEIIVIIMLTLYRQIQQQQILIFSYFSWKIGFGMSCKLSPLETICMKCQNLFSLKNKKSISKCCLLRFLSSMLSIKSEIIIIMILILHQCMMYCSIISSSSPLNKAGRLGLLACFRAWVIFKHYDFNSASMHDVL